MCGVALLCEEFFPYVWSPKFLIYRQKVFAYNERMSAYRITYRNAGGTRYSYVDDGFPEGYLTEGEWTAPFPNTQEESTAFGLVESLLQSDDCLSDFRDDPPNFIKVEKV